MSLPDEYIVFDLETTDLPSRRGGRRHGELDFSAVHITEIGAVHVRLGAIVRDFDILVQIPNGAEISAEAESLNGITTVMLEGNGVPLHQALLAFRAWVDPSGDTCLVGQNIAAFDLPILAQHHAGAFAGWRPWRLKRVYDTKLLYIARRMGWQRCPHESTATFTARLAADAKKYTGLSNLDHLALEFSVKIDAAQRHRALYDAYIEMEIFERLRIRGYGDAYSAGDD